MIRACRNYKLSRLKSSGPMTIRIHIVLPLFPRCLRVVLGRNLQKVNRPGGILWDDALSRLSATLMGYCQTPCGSWLVVRMGLLIGVRLPISLMGGRNAIYASRAFLTCDGNAYLSSWSLLTGNFYSAFRKLINGVLCETGSFSAKPTHTHSRKVLRVWQIFIFIVYPTLIKSRLEYILKNYWSQLADVHLQHVTKREEKRIDAQVDNC